MKYLTIIVLAWIAVILLVSESDSLSILLATKVAGLAIAYAAYRLAYVFNLIEDAEEE